MKPEYDPRKQTKNREKKIAFVPLQDPSHDEPLSVDVRLLLQLFWKPLRDGSALLMRGKSLTCRIRIVKPKRSLTATGPSVRRVGDP